MFARLKQIVRIAPGRNLLILFAVSVVLPGLILAVFSASALVTERRSAASQIRERLGRTVDAAARELERVLVGWETAGEAIASGGRDTALLPADLRNALTEPGAGITIIAGVERVEAWPPQQLLYLPDSAATWWGAEAPAAPALVEAETVELAAKDYARALVLYERLLSDAPPADRARVLHRLARTHQKAGHTDEALKAYQRLASMSERIGALPADLIARVELTSPWAARGDPAALRAAAANLYSDLVAGRWTLEKSRYTFYSTEARTRAIANEPPSATISSLDAMEAAKRALADAAAPLVGPPHTPGVMAPRVELALDSPGYVGLSIGGTSRAGRPSVTLVVDRQWLAERVWTPAFADQIHTGFDLSVIDGTGSVIFTSAAHVDPGNRTTWTETRTAERAGTIWRVVAGPRDLASLSADLTRLQTVYAIVLVTVVGLLGFGTYLTARVVRREVEIARLKSDFVSTVSHEFRSPLTGIRQLGEMLMRGRVPSEARRQEYYERITKESDRLSRLVENLLDFSRMEEGRKEYRFEQLDPSEWLRAVAADCQAEFADRSVAVISTIPDTLPLLVADQEALSSAVHNLVENAIKYSPGREAVWLEAEGQNSQLTIRVRDAGIGISPEDQTRIFEKFYRGRDPIARQIKGVGLGLSLVQHIVHAHGGRVDCHSRQGEGTTFSIHLNAAPASGL